MKKSISFYFFAFILIVISLLIFKNNKSEGKNWSYPYFSGAANFKKTGDWKISKTDFNNIKYLSESEYRKYRHKKTTEVIDYTYNNYGYVLLILISRNLFYNIGDMEGIILFQIIIHILTSFIFLRLIFIRLDHKLLFLFFYASNPLIIQIVTFPFYYFWMFIPSFFILIIKYKPKFIPKIVFIATPFIILSLWVRPTTIFISLFFYITAYFYVETIKHKIIVTFNSALIILFFGFLISASKSTPIHSMFVGIGAYPGNHKFEKIDDSNGFDFYQYKTGVKINSNPINGNWNSYILRDNYYSIITTEYLNFVQLHPYVIVRNSFFNFILLYSFGYFNSYKILTIINLFLGFIMIFFLLYNKLYYWFFSIFLSALGFIFYFPPIPAYNYSAYLLFIPIIIFLYDNYISYLYLKIFRKNEFL